MSKEDDYRENAAETVDLANRAGTVREKGRLLALAEKWLDLADRAHSYALGGGRKFRQHPLITEVFGDEQPEAD